MSLFQNDPPIEQWFKDLFAELVDACPEMTKNRLNASQVKARTAKYWHAFHKDKPESIRRAFEQAAITCEFFPSVPKIQDIQSAGFGSQPFTPRKDYEQGRILTSADIDLLKKKAGLRGME